MAICESVDGQVQRRLPVVLASFLSQCAGCLHGRRDDPRHKDLNDTWSVHLVQCRLSSNVEENQ